MFLLWLCVVFDDSCMSIYLFCVVFVWGFFCVFYCLFFRN